VRVAAFEELQEELCKAEAETGKWFVGAALLLNILEVGFASLAAPSMVWQHVLIIWSCMSFGLNHKRVGNDLAIMEHRLRIR